MAAVELHMMSEPELLQWVEANPGRVNDRDSLGHTPLLIAALLLRDLPLTVWLLDEKGADANARCVRGSTALYGARSLAILTTLLDRGADPAVIADSGATLLMMQAGFGSVDMVARLLQDPRVQTTVNAQITRSQSQSNRRKTALHIACTNENETWATSIVHLLLQAGTDPKVTDDYGQTPLAYLRHFLPSRHAAIALLEQAPDAEKASLLIKARRLVVATISNVIAPSCPQSRAARDEPLPRVVLTPVTVQQNNGRRGRSQVSHSDGVCLGDEGRVGKHGYAPGCVSGRDGSAHAIMGPAAAEGCRCSPIRAGLRREASGDKKKASGESGCRER